MSKEQANAFRTFVNENESIQGHVRKGNSDGSLELTKLADQECPQEK